ncbi:MAG: hypothetical protein AB9Q18_04590 [Candidatus Reddybacter sp.]
MPQQWIPKLKTIMRVLRPGSLTAFNVPGICSNEDRNRCIELFGKEVLPVLREYADSIGLTDSFEREPDSVKLTPGTKRAPVVDRSGMEGLGLK